MEPDRGAGQVQVAATLCSHRHPGGARKPVVRREIRLARQEGKTVSPVKGPVLGDLAKLPRWLGQIYDLDLPEPRTTAAQSRHPMP